MAVIQKIFNTNRLRVFLVFSAFLLMAGFLFWGIAKTAYADMPIQDILGNSLTKEQIIAVDNVVNNPDACTPATFILTPIICSLMVVLGFVTLLLQAAASLFGWVVQVGNMNAVINAGSGGTGGSVIYQLWTMVRDLLNIAFILVLLFSAFATIFQVEKFNYKKLLLNLILMALLVNFSYPIARFIIDVSNVLMYTLIRSVLAPAVGGDATKSFGILTENGGIKQFLVPAGTSITYLLAAIVFTALLAITLLAVAVMFIIRMVALTILIIFSPIAFVGAILPGTKAGSLSSDWWTSLFKYAFFGPMMIFIIYITARIMAVMSSTAVMNTFVSSSNSNSTDPNIVGAIAFFSIPIVLLWMGLGVAQKSGVAGASAVMGYAQKTGSWAGKKFSGYNAVSKRYSAYKAERKKRDDEKFKGNLGSTIGKGLNRRQDEVLGKLGFEKARKRADKMIVDQNKEDIDKGAKDLTDQGADAYTLGHSLNSDFARKDNKPDKIDQARQAAAYKKQDYNEKRNHVKSVVHNTNLADRNGLDNIINISANDIGLDSASTDPAMMAKVAAYNTEQAAIQARITHVKANVANTLSSDQQDEVTAFVNKQMGRKIKLGAEAK